MKFRSSLAAHYAELKNTSPDAELSASFLSHESDSSNEAQRTLRDKGRRAWQSWRLALETLLLVSSLAFLVAAVRQHSFDSKLEQQRRCGRLLGQWLPDADTGVAYGVQRFKGSFGLKSPFTGVGPEVDAAWDNITDGPIGGAIGISKEQWEAVNEYHEYPVMLDEDQGTGQYLASLDVFHQLHCVDLLRKNIHRAYYNEHEGSFAGASPRVIEGHLEHCVETLRQTLMCHGDISLLTYNWVAGREMPYPNFNTVHTCKKWDALVAWNMARDMSTQWEDGERKAYKPPLKPEGVRGMEHPP